MISQSASIATLPPELSHPATPLGRGVKAAREFECQLVTSLLESLEKTFAAVPGGNTPGADDYNYMGTQALASAITSAGGFGIAAMIAPHLNAAGKTAHEGGG